MESVPFFRGKTLDDAMRLSFQHILENGKRVCSSRGNNLEVLGALLEIENPRARLSRTETRGRLFSCLGELLWYLGKTRSIEMIGYYIPDYYKESENGEVHGGYGPRIFNWDGITQFDNVVQRLNSKPSTRKASIQIFDAKDLEGDHKDIPCTCSMQFFIRDGKLHMHTHMRSNDVFKGLPHDVFSFTMLQEIMARTVGVELGFYRHTAGSLHLYKNDYKDAELFVGEGWQSTDSGMPEMPMGDPWDAIEILLKAESSIRKGEFDYSSLPESLHSYWIDLIKILLFYYFFKNKNSEKAETIRQSISCKLFDCFLAKKIDDLSQVRFCS